MKKAWMVAGGALLLVGGAAPWLVGKLTEHQWQEATRELNVSQTFFQLETRDYDRRFFNSDLNGSLIIQDPGSGKVTVIPYHGEVSHGVTGSRFTFSTVGTASETVQELFPEERPSLVVQSHLWGTLTVELNVPAISVEDAETGESLNMAESYGWATISDGGAETEVEMRWPGLVARGPGMRLNVEDLRLSQSMQRVRGDVWSGEGDIAFARIGITYPEQPPLTLQQLSLHGQTRTDDDERTFSSEATLELASVAVADDDYGPHRIEFAIGQADIDAWNRLTAAFSNLQTQAVINATPQAQFEHQMRLVMQVTEALRELAGKGITVGVPAVSLQSPEGEVTGSLELRHPALSEQERTQMLLVLQRLTGDLKLSLPVALVNAVPELKARLAPMLAQGLLVRDGDVYRLEAELKDLTVDVNGNQIPVPPLI